MLLFLYCVLKYIQNIKVKPLIIVVHTFVFVEDFSNMNFQTFVNYAWNNDGLIHAAVFHTILFVLCLDYSRYEVYTLDNKSVWHTRINSYQSMRCAFTNQFFLKFDSKNRY